MKPGKKAPSRIPPIVVCNAKVDIIRDAIRQYLAHPTYLLHGASGNNGI